MQEGNGGGGRCPGGVLDKQLSCAAEDAGVRVEPRDTSPVLPDIALQGATASTGGVHAPGPAQAIATPVLAVVVAAWFGRSPVLHVHTRACSRAARHRHRPAAAGVPRQSGGVPLRWSSWVDSHVRWGGGRGW